MTHIRPLRDKVIGKMLEPIGFERRTKAGIILTEDETSETFIRPRWFEVTHTGPEQEDILVGQYVLVPHGRWSRGIDLDNANRVDEMLFLVDHNDVLGVQDDDPIS